MESIKGIWKGGTDNHWTWEFTCNENNTFEGSFRNYTAADSTKITSGSFIATGSMLTLQTDGGDGVNRYEINGDTLNIYPLDGGSPIVLKRDTATNADVGVSANNVKGYKPCKGYIDRFFWILVLGLVILFACALAGGFLSAVIVAVLYLVLVFIIGLVFDSVTETRLKNRAKRGGAGAQLILGNFLLSNAASNSKSEDFDAAEKILKEVHEQGGKCPQAYYDSGVLLMERNKYDRAQKWLIIAAEQGHAEAQSKLNECITKAGEAEQKAAESQRAAAAEAARPVCARPGCGRKLPADMRYGAERHTPNGTRFYCCRNCKTLDEFDR